MYVYGELTVYHSRGFRHGYKRSSPNCPDTYVDKRMSLSDQLKKECVSQKCEWVLQASQIDPKRVLAMMSKTQTKALIRPLLRDPCPSTMSIVDLRWYFLVQI